LGVDVVHDLAIVGTALRPPAHFGFGGGVAQGTRLYALGHPRDLGLSIVEGTYNGPLPHTLYPRLHFTGSLNPGMSGGPTLAEDGRVIGVNVSTAGEQLSFLVPADRAAALLQRVLAPGGAPPGRTLADVGRQLRDYQDAYLRDMFAGPTQTVPLGPYRLVTQPAPYFRCWADATRRPELPYEQVQHRCSTDDGVFIFGDQATGVIELKHELLSTRTLNAARFYALYTQVFSRDETPSGEEEHVTSWRCATRNVRHAAVARSAAARSGEMRMRAVLCLRRYRKLGALYDGVLKVAVLGRRNVGVVSTLTLTGVTFENVDRLTRRYLEQVAWR
jgi:serine protease Do